MAQTTFSGPVRSLNGFVAGTGSATINKVRAATATLDFPSIAANGAADLTITVTGAAVGDYVTLALPAAPAAGLMFMGFVSAADTVTVRARNLTASPVDAGSATYGALVFGAA